MKNLLFIKPFLETLRDLKVLNNQQIKHINRFLSMGIIFTMGVIISIITLIVYVDRKSIINSYRKRYVFHNEYLFSVYLEPVLIRLFIGLLQLVSGLSIWIVLYGVFNHAFVLKDLIFAILICTITFFFTRLAKRIIISEKVKKVS